MNTVYGMGIVLEAARTGGGRRRGGGNMNMIRGRSPNGDAQSPKRRKQSQSPSPHSPPGLVKLPWDVLAKVLAKLPRVDAIKLARISSNLLTPGLAWKNLVRQIKAWELVGTSGASGAAYTLVVMPQVRRQALDRTVEALQKGEEAAFRLDRLSVELPDQWWVRKRTGRRRVDGGDTHDTHDVATQLALWYDPRYGQISEEYRGFGQGGDVVVRAIMQKLLPPPPGSTSSGSHTPLNDRSAPYLVLKSLKLKNFRGRLLDEERTLEPRGLWRGKWIAEVLSSNTVLTFLCLEECRPLDSGCGKIGEAFAKNTTLESLHLVDCEISHVGATAIASGLRNAASSRLTELRIIMNNIGDNGAVAIAQALRDDSTLTHLDLSSAHISNRGAAEIATALQQNRTLQTLNLADNKIGFGQVPGSIGGIPSQFPAPTAGVGAGGAAPPGAVVWVSQPSPNSIHWALSNNNKLNSLNLSHNEIGGMDLEVLANGLQNNVTLTHLNLGSNNKIDDLGVAALARVLHKTAITHLSLSHPSFGEPGVEALAAALGKAGCPLTTLSLAFPSFWEDDAIHSLALALSANQSLRSLDLRGASDTMVNKIQAAVGEKEDFELKLRRDEDEEENISF